MDPATATAVAGGIFDIGKKLVDKFIPDPEKRALAEAQLFQMVQTGEFKELETRMTAIYLEAQSDDPFVKRARPSFLYVFYFVIIALVVVAPTIGVFYPEQMKMFFANVKAGFEAVPGELWAVFTAGFMGYSYNRSQDKRSQLDALVKMKK